MTEQELGTHSPYRFQDYHRLLAEALVAHPKDTTKPQFHGFEHIHLPVKEFNSNHGARTRYQRAVSLTFRLEGNLISEEEHFRFSRRRELQERAGFPKMIPAQGLKHPLPPRKP